MKKTLLSCSAVLLLMSSLKAQTFNNTYNVPGYSCDKPAVIPADQKRFYSYMVSNLTDGSDPYHVLLSRLDLDGVVNLSFRLDGITIGTWAGRYFLGTKDGGVLLACIDDHDQVVVLKFDADLNQQWGVRMPENIGFQGEASLGIISTASFAGNTDDEDYIVTAPVETPYGGYPNDKALMAFRLDVNGNLLWKKSYAEQNRPGDPSTLIRDHVTTITHSIPQTAGTLDDEFVIAGTRTETGFAPSDLFAMRINGAGDVVSNFMTYTPIASSGKSRPQIMTDRNTGAYVCAYTQYNMGPTATDPSAIALLKLDYGLNATGDEGYFVPSSTENYVSSIRQSGDGHYVVSSCPTLYDYYQGYRVPYLVKIDRASQAVIFNQRYNISSSAFLDYDGGTMDDNDNSYLISTVNTNPGTTIKDLRLIKADPVGQACGNLSGEIYRLPIPLSQQSYVYEGFDNPLFDFVHYDQAELSLNASNCGTAYFRGGVAAALQGEVKVYPTLLTATDVLSCEVKGNYSGKISVAITNVLGQRVFFKEYNAEAVSSVSVPANVLSTGLNVITVYNNGTLIRTEKVVRKD